MHDDALVASYLLDGSGARQQPDWELIHQWQPGQGVLWVRLNRSAESTTHWLRGSSGLDPLVVGPMLEDSTRLRYTQTNGGVMLILRGVNLNPGADPEDTVSIRLWIEESRIISVRARRLLSIDDMRASLDAGRRPREVGEFIVGLAGVLVAPVADVISDVDRLQDQVLEIESARLRTDLTRVRCEIIALRRYLAPQRDALACLTQLKLSWLDDMGVLQLREEADRVIRYVEDLDTARERAAVMQEELSSKLAEQVNARMYVLLVIAAIFLPLGFLTGLFGIDVGGIPLAENPWIFFEVVLILAVITLSQVLLFRWRRWL